MTPPGNGERLALRSERDRLAANRRELDLELARLKDSDDAKALHSLGVRLRRHAEELHAYNVALHAFHLRVGPLEP